MNGEPYQLRFFFDPGSGVCLWAENDQARERFGYARDDLSLLPISRETQAKADELIARYDTSLNWDDPAGPSPWTEAKGQAFEVAAALLERIRAELGKKFDMVDDRISNQLLPYTLP